jgi:hypothetical protein
MGELMSGSDLFDVLAHEFAERYRLGERPSLHEYTDRYPELAEEIQEMFPALMMMEQLGSEAEPPSDHVPGWSSSEEPMPEQR